jgi:hypothetical protein
LIDPSTIEKLFQRRPGGGIDFVNDLAMPARLAVVKAHKEGIVESGFIGSVRFTWKDSRAEGWAWICARDDLYLFRKTAIREYQFRCGIGPGELAEDVSCSGLEEDLLRFQNDDAVLIRSSDIQAAIDDLMAHFDLLDHTSHLERLQFGEGPRGYQRKRS